MASQERFGYEWNKYQKMDPRYELQFSQWVSPLGKKDFAGKRVLDVGCGMGRNSYWAADWGAKSVTAFDFDTRSVEAAERTLAPFPAASVRYQNVFEFAEKEKYDLAFSIGVIHHLERPAEAIQRMTDAVVSGGKVVIWVYSYEGNEWIVRFVNPVRENITSRLPLSLVHFLSYFCSVPLYLIAKTFKGPGTYVRQLGTFDFWHVHSIVFDQLIPTIAHYWKREEALALFDAKQYATIEIHRPPHGTGWTIIATKK